MSDDLAASVEVELLRAKLERERQRTARLKARIEKARQIAGGAVKATDPVLAQPSGVPRGKWSFCKGVNHLGRAMLHVLGGQ